MSYGTHLDHLSDQNTPVHRLDSRTKIICFLSLVVISVSTPPQAVAAFAAYLAFILVVAFSSRIPWGYLLKRLLLIVPFVSVVALSLPFLNPNEPAGAYTFGIGGVRVSESGLMVLWNVCIKATVGVLSVSLLMATTRFSNLLQGFEQLRVPQVFIMLAGFLYRYFFVLADEVNRMKRARDSRCYGGRWLWHSRVIGQMVGTLFLRSYERAERVYLAMVSRGFDGRAVSLGRTRLSILDLLFLSAVLTFFLGIRIGVA